MCTNAKIGVYFLEVYLKDYPFKINNVLYLIRFDSVNLITFFPTGYYRSDGVHITG